MPVEVPVCPELGARMDPDAACRIIFPQQRLGPWLLGCDANYMLVLSSQVGSDLGFLERLLLHGLFVLPSPRSLVAACPWPRTPYLLEVASVPQHRWRGKKLRRYSGTFRLTVNWDFRKHMRLCARYHEKKGGTWITAAFVEQLWQLHSSPLSPIRVWAFELWDKATGALAAASFGLSAGAFFHDFSMCTLVEDHRSGGAVLTRCIGELLGRCGMHLWYWGCKMDYMREYDVLGGREASRQEYYERLRAAVASPVAMDPAEAAAGALVAPWVDD